ncbi:MAG: response regulator, NarL-family [Betaproteobacteria bacterium]|nr:response regulator, NarL-family [Betaproteobacteria bacterium]
MTSILVVDDHQIVRAGIRSLLAHYDDFTVAGEASSGNDALEMVRKREWGIVLLDISMPSTHGLDILKQIKRQKPALPVLIYTMHPEECYAINLMRAGASGYLCKVCSPEQLVIAIRTVVSGRRYVSPTLGEHLAGQLKGDSQLPPHTQLSELEFQIFCKLAIGQALTSIADELLLSVKTVSIYRSRILETMNLGTNGKLMYYAIKHGLV